VGVHKTICLNSLDYNNIMERFAPASHRGPGPTPGGGSSSAGNSEQHPERAYGTDLRYLDKEEKQTASKSDADNIVQQRRVKKFLAAARASGKHQQNTLVDEPQIRGKTPRTSANINGTNVPTLGDRIGTGGSVNYARKPKSKSGKFVGFS
jgi:hypothetical protein